MRLDNFLVEKKFFNSRTKAKQAVLRGEIFVDGEVVLRPSYELVDGRFFNVEYIYNQKFVSLGGYKLDKALKDFGFSVNGLTVADVGASTGGFTDCLLQKGAKKVFAVDLNDDLLDNSLKNDIRVKPIIKNAKNLEKNDFTEDLDLICADLSFISASVVLPVFSNLLDIGKFLILLIKPQFENDEKIKFKNGIIKDKKYHIKSINKIYDSLLKNGFSLLNITKTDNDKDKNVEFLVLAKKGQDKSIELNGFFDSL